MADDGVARARFCSRCGQPVVVANARFCKECGAPLAGSPMLMRDLTWQPLLAAALSLLPGLGHLYRHRPLAALAWFVGVLLAYSIAQPFGFILHLVCAGNAALSGALSENAIVARLRQRRGSSRYAPPPA
ncbi:MAG TPA: zinc ribbon domain-containing protein [Candidatus Binataceae bacterium]|nr:zinc ribbon domain-containing protein [Candidatus Binataceae bacterium]